MNLIEDRVFDEERALYEKSDTVLKKCRFDGPLDGESALKECSNIQVENCYFNLRYPFWHGKDLTIKDTELTEKCRAALWYSNGVRISGTKLHGVKALRECADVQITDCSIVSPEFGWSLDNVRIENCTAESEYFMMHSKNLEFRSMKLNGKYSFQYIENAVFENCIFDTKDAFWHGKNITVRNSVVKGEYLAWYSENLTLEHCRIFGTQPFCYCKGLKLIDCELFDADLCFEKSEVEATITTPVISIKNLLAGTVRVPSVGEIICADSRYKGKVEIL